MEKTYNDLVFAIAKKAHELANLKMNELREENGYDCNTPGEARTRNKHYTRGEMIAEIIEMEFLEDVNKEWE